MRKLSESTARTTIGMMRSIASHKPISPFHLMAADEMERLLEEVLQYRALPERKWVKLTKDEVFAVSNTMPYGDRFDFAEAIEAKLKELNT